MSDNNAIIIRVREHVLGKIKPRLQLALEDAAMSLRQRSDLASDGRTLQDQRDRLIDQFCSNLSKRFGALMGEPMPKVSIADYGKLALVEEGDLEAMIAMEGMVAYTRNCDISQALAFVTRLDSLFFGMRVDESNNPMDPEQIGDALTETLRPLGLNPGSLLVIYRHFNTAVFHRLEQILESANNLLIALDVIPDLDMAARNKKEILNKRGQPRERSDPNVRAFSASGSESSPPPAAMPQMSIIKTLIHSADAPQELGAQQAVSSVHQPGVDGVPTLTGQIRSGMMIGGQRVEVISGAKLLQVLDEQEVEQSIGSALAQGQAFDLSDSICHALQAASGDRTLKAIDSESADIISLVTLLYEAVWQDRAVPLPIKELIGRTQLVVLKQALQDSSFFERDDHPLRLLINELAASGISWTEAVKLDSDPVYQQMRKLVGSLVDSDELNEDKLTVMLQEFVQFKAELRLKQQDYEALLRDADARKERLDEVRHYARQKIAERILDPKTPEFIRDFLDQYFHAFLVEVVLREGPGGISWKPIMNTIDVLLWTVQYEKEEGDRERFAKVNRKLLDNLGKALHVGGIEKPKAEELLKQIEREQERSFAKFEKQEPISDAPVDSFEDWMAAATAEFKILEQALPENDEHLQEVSKYPIGIWLEFAVDESYSIRCTLAAHIKSIDKLVFVNSQGVKVIEKSRVGLARELKAGSVKVISCSPLVDRALESVICKLRQTVSA